jgi:ribonuclease D
MTSTEARTHAAHLDDLPPPRLVDSSPAYTMMLAELANEKALALDTESDSLYCYFHKVCLIQISTPTQDYLVDPLALPDISALGEIIADPTVEKVFHAAENDILVLKRDFKFTFANIFDTLIAARILGWQRVGLAAVLAEHFDLKLDKRTQLTDWGRRPLSPEQMRYARLDSHYLLSLRDLLIDALHKQDRWRETEEAFGALPDVEYIEKPFDPHGFWRTKGAKSLEPQELAILRELYLWRNEQAKKMDRPPFKVMTDRTLVELSHRQPRRLNDLRLRDWQVRRYGKALLSAIAHGRAAAPPQRPARQHDDNNRPDPETVTRYDRLRGWRTQRAKERGVDSDIVLNNATLMAIARSAPANLEALAALGVMGPWKLETYGGDVLKVIAPR